jgi:hypothetical protein
MTTIKKTYEKPSVMVYRLKTQSTLLAGSPQSQLPLGDHDEPEATTIDQW